MDDLLDRLESEARFRSGSFWRGGEEITVAAEDTVEWESAVEIRRLRAAFDWHCEKVFEGYAPDGMDWQDEMERRGLLVEVPASPEFREEYDADTMLVQSWRDEVRAEQGGGEPEPGSGEEPS